MRKMICSAFAVMLTVCVSLCFSVTASASSRYDCENDDTGYEVIIDDFADLLSDDEESSLANEMKGLTEYGNACFLTLDSNDKKAEKAAKNTYRDYFGSQSGALFLIDMDNRKVCLYTDGTFSDVINKKYCLTITDNVYKLAKNEEYYKCASKTFSQVSSLMDGKKISQPMKHISNLLFAAAIAVLLNYIIVMRMCKNSERSTYGTTAGSTGDIEMIDLQIEKGEPEVRAVSEGSSDSSSGGRSGSSGGGGSSGSHSF